MLAKLLTLIRTRFFMGRLAVVLMVTGSIQMFAQKLFVYPKEATAPRGSYQTITAIVTGVNDKTVTWSASGGKLVGNNPCAVNEPCTVALYSAGSGSFHVKAVSNANHSVAAESAVRFTGSPTPVASHPRLMITQSMLPGLRAKATSRDVIYQTIKARGEQAFARDNAVWSWSCKGGDGLPRANLSESYKEFDANLFAFLSIVAPTPAERKAWGCYGRDVWVYVMNAVLAKKETIQGNHWSDSAVQFALTTDWLLAGNYLRPEDEERARQFLAVTTRTVLGYSYGVTAKTTGYNSSSQFDEHKPYDLVGMRSSGNNYTMSKMLYLVAAALTFNDTASDDPPTQNSCEAKRYQVCPDYSAGSLHAYWTYFTDAMLYRMYAHLEDPDVSWQAYQLAFGDLSKQPRCLYIDGSSHPCFGDGRGGESSEGSWYQYSLFRLRYALNMAHTAGYDDPILYGPQISLGTSSWWDLKYVSDLLFLTSFGANGNENRPAYSYFTTGDTYSYERRPSDFITEASMMVEDSYVGRKDRAGALKWLIMNSAFGGPLGRSGNCKEYCGLDAELANDFGSPLAMDLMIALPAGDPVASLPADPRPFLPTDLFNGSFNQHAILRTAGPTGETAFSIYCPNTLIDHEHEFCGRFDIFSNGEYITKGRTEFTDYNNRMSSSSQNNTMSIANVSGTGCKDDGCEVYNAVLDGGQFWHGQQQGFNLMTHSELPSYAGFLFNDTPAYNGWWASSSPFDVPSYNDVTKASRSLVYLRATNQVVFYDRGATRHAADKAVYLITTGPPLVAGDEATWLTRSGRQRAYLTSMLPVHAKVAKADLIAGGINQKNDWEPAATLKVSAGDPTSIEFLSVLEWGRASLKRTPTALVQSASGQHFDGAKVGSSLVMFMRDWPARFTGVVYPASGATVQYISDLMPNTPYVVAVDGASQSVKTDTAGVLTFSVSDGGNISIWPRK